MFPSSVLILITFLRIASANDTVEKVMTSANVYNPPTLPSTLSFDKPDLPEKSTDQVLPAEPAVLPKTCTSTESVCPSCDYMAVCVDQGDGTFNTLLQKCRDNENCVGGKCVEGAICSQGMFACRQEGNFPDLYDCTKYHVCLYEGGKFRKETFICNGTSYDAERRSCGRGLKTETCRKGPVPECTSRGQMGVVPLTKSMYYFCVEKDGILSPDLYACPKGYDINIELKKCESNECEQCKEEH